jgi:hypothetical protein
VVSDVTNFESVEHPRKIEKLRPLNAPASRSRFSSRRESVQPCLCKALDSLASCSRARTVQTVNQTDASQETGKILQQGRKALLPAVLILTVFWFFGGNDYFYTYPRPSWVTTEALATKSRFEGGKVRESHVTVSFEDSSGVQHEAEYLALDRVARAGDRVEIRYNPDHPTSIVLDDPNWWVVPTRKVLLISTPGLLSVALLLFQRLARRRNVRQNAHDAARVVEP